MLVVLLFFGLLIVPYLSWVVCSVSWYHWYARLYAVCQCMFAFPVNVIGMLDCVLSDMVCLLFLLMSLVC